MIFPYNIFKTECTSHPHCLRKKYLLNLIKFEFEQNGKFVIDERDDYRALFRLKKAKSGVVMIRVSKNFNRDAARCAKYNNRDFCEVGFWWETIHTNNCLKKKCSSKNCALRTKILKKLSSVGELTGDLQRLFTAKPFSPPIEIDLE